MAGAAVRSVRGRRCSLPRCCSPCVRAIFRLLRLPFAIWGWYGGPRGRCGSLRRSALWSRTVGLCRVVRARRPERGRRATPCCVLQTGGAWGESIPRVPLAFGVDGGQGMGERMNRPQAGVRLVVVGENSAELALLRLRRRSCVPLLAVTNRVGRETVVRCPRPPVVRSTILFRQLRLFAAFKKSFVAMPHLRLDAAVAVPENGPTGGVETRSREIFTGLSPVKISLLRVSLFRIGRASGAMRRRSRPGKGCRSLGGSGAFRGLGARSRSLPVRPTGRAGRTGSGVGAPPVVPCRRRCDAAHAAGARGPFPAGRHFPGRMRSSAASRASSCGTATSGSAP